MTPLELTIMVLSVKVRAVYHTVKNKPASGEKTIIITENVKDSIDMSVARCSDGNMFCKRVLVRTWSASSAIDDIKPPSAIRTYKPECSSAMADKITAVAIVNIAR